MGEMTKVAQANDLAPGKAMCVEVAGQKVALFNIDGSYYAIGESCTHVGGPCSPIQSGRVHAFGRGTRT